MYVNKMNSTEKNRYNIISEYIYKDESLYLVKKNNLFNIKFNSKNALYSCKKCTTGICLNDNEDWIINKWNKYLFKNDIESFDIINTIYIYIKDIFECMLFMNKNELKYFFSITEYKFVLEKYEDKLVFLLIYTQYLIDLDIFTKEFYHNFRLKDRFSNYDFDNNNSSMFSETSVKENSSLSSLRSDKFIVLVDKIIDSISKISLNNLPKKIMYKSFVIEKNLNYHSMFLYLDTFLFNLKEYPLFRHMFNNKTENCSMDYYLETYYTITIPNFNYDTFLIYYDEIKKVSCVWNSIICD